MLPPSTLKALQAYADASANGAAKIQAVRNSQRQAAQEREDLIRLIQSILQDFAQRFVPEKGDKGDKGDSIVGPKGDSIVGPMGPAGRDGVGEKGERGLPGKDGNANIPEIIDISQQEVGLHEKKFDHTLLHDPFIVGTMTVDETDKAEGKVQVVQGKKLVYRPFPKAAPNGQIHGGGSSILRKDSTGTDFIRRRINLIEGSGVTITMADDPNDLETDVTIAATGGSSVNYADKEVPSGVIDGVNVTFTLAHTPVLGSEYVFLNGVLLSAEAGGDYTIAGAVLTMTFAPRIGHVQTRLVVSYRYS